MSCDIAAARSRHARTCVNVRLIGSHAQQPCSCLQRSLDVHERSEEDDLSIDEDRNVIIRRLGHAVGFRRFRRAQTALGWRVRRSGRRVGETRVAACGCDRLGVKVMKKLSKSALRSIPMTRGICPKL